MRTWKKTQGKVESFFTARVCSCSFGREDMRPSKLTVMDPAPSNATLAEAPDHVKSWRGGGEGRRQGGTGAVLMACRGNGRRRRVAHQTAAQRQQLHPLQAVTSKRSPMPHYQAAAHLRQRAACARVSGEEAADQAHERPSGGGGGDRGVRARRDGQAHIARKTHRQGGQQRQLAPAGCHVRELAMAQMSGVRDRHRSPWGAGGARHVIAETQLRRERRRSGLGQVVVGGGAPAARSCGGRLPASRHPAHPQKLRGSIQPSRHRASRLQFS